MDKLLPAEGPPGLKGERWCYLETERYWGVAMAEVCIPQARSEAD